VVVEVAVGRLVAGMVEVGGPEDSAHVGAIGLALEPLPWYWIHCIGRGTHGMFGRKSEPS